MDDPLPSLANRKPNYEIVKVKQANKFIFLVLSWERLPVKYFSISNFHCHAMFPVNLNEDEICIR